jgi:hypothetical protein
MKPLIIVCLIFYFVFPCFAQRATPLSRSEFGVIAGGSYYIGDLNQFRHFENTQIAGGFLYRFNIHSRLSLRGNFIYGNVKGDDANSRSDLLKNRNLNFFSSIFELAGGVEFNYFPFEIGHKNHKGTAYILTEIGVFRMNPMTRYQGQNIELQPLGTEGQGTSLSSKNNYSLTQLCVPLGVGARMTLGKWVCLGAEFGIRKTFTDYLDDVHAGSYVDPDILVSENGPTAGLLSNRSLDGSRFGKRGTASSKDWYVFSGVMLTIRLGKKNSCFYTHK